VWKDGSVGGLKGRRKEGRKYRRKVQDGRVTKIGRKEYEGI
jgi:hypothetical protein